MGLAGCGTPPASPETGRAADAAEVPLPQRVLPHPTQTKPAPPSDYSAIGERDLFQPKLLPRRRKPNNERTNPLPPAAPLVAPLPPMSPASGAEQKARETEPHPLTGWRVVGVIIADGRQAAWLEDAKHQTVWVEVGATIADGEKVVAISSSGVTVQGKDGQEVVLNAQAMQGWRFTLKQGRASQSQPFENRIIGKPRTDQ
jgi:hypothetical protein